MTWYFTALVGRLQQTLGLAIMLLPSLVLANTSFVASGNMPTITPKDEMFGGLTSTMPKMTPTQQSPLSENVATPITETELLANIDLFNDVVSQAIERNDVRGLQILLPVYATALNKDEILYLYAKAVIKEKRDIRQAIHYYQQILAINPTLTPIRVRLITAYLANHQVHTAKDELNIAQKDPMLPSDVSQYLQKQLDDFARHTKHVSVHYLDDDNVNNAPTTTHHEQWQLPSAESAHGMGYFAQLSKKHYLKDHVALGANLSVQGKYYWDNPDYNDIIIEIAPMLSHHHHDRRLDMGIYHQKRYFGDDLYSDITGLRFVTFQRFGSEYEGELKLDIAKKHHQDRPFLDGNSQSVVANLSHIDRYHHYLSVGLVNDHAREPSESYQQGMIFFGTTRTWGGFGTAHHVGVGRRIYQGVDFFGIDRTDWRYHTEHSIWHQKLHYKGYHPSFHLRFDRIDSNHFVHDSKNMQVFLSVNRKF